MSKKHPNKYEIPKENTTLSVRPKTGEYYPYAKRHPNGQREFLAWTHRNSPNEEFRRLREMDQQGVRDLVVDGRVQPDFCPIMNCYWQTIKVME